VSLDLPPLHPLISLALAHLADTISSLFEHESDGSTCDWILQPPDANSGEGLPKLQDVSVAQTSPPEPPRSSEPPGKTTVLQILTYTPISFTLCAMPTRC
jgi:hypothetical protein